MTLVYRDIQFISSSRPLLNAALCPIAVHRCKRAIDLESELSVAVALYSLAPNQMAHRTVYPMLKYLWFKFAALCDG